MLVDPNKYAFHTRKRSKRNRTLFFFAALLVAGGLVVFLVVILPRIRANRATAYGEEMDIYAMWEAGLYHDITVRCKEGLETHPMDGELLMFYGMAQYYRAYFEKALEDKLPLLDESIASLRKALLLETVGYRPQIYYILGQAYYHKGPFYYDLAIRYIEKSLQEGYHGPNAYEYMAIAYGGMGQPELELESFLKAYESDQSDFVLLSIGKAYLKLNRPGPAKDFLLRCLNKTSDSNIEKECRFNLAEIYSESGEFLKAEDQLEAIIRLDDGSAEAHFRLGELYDRMNNIVRAVAEWKKTLAIDSTHYGARRRLYK
jgi:tetratricopeptide (TPR) repeat protein